MSETKFKKRIEYRKNGFSLKSRINTKVVVHNDTDDDSSIMLTLFNANKDEVQNKDGIIHGANCVGVGSLKNRVSVVGIKINKDVFEDMVMVYLSQNKDSIFERMKEYNEN